MFLLKSKYYFSIVEIGVRILERGENGFVQAWFFVHKYKLHCKHKRQENVYSSTFSYSKIFIWNLIDYAIYSMHWAYSGLVLFKWYFLTYVALMMIFAITFIFVNTIKSTRNRILPFQSFSPLLQKLENYDTNFTL